MSNILLDDNNDIVFENDQLQFSTGDIELQQRVKAFLELNLGEWFLNTARGVPYTAEFVEPTADINKIAMYLRGLLLQIDGVRAIDEINLTKNGTTRKLSGALVINRSITVTF